MKFSFPLSLKVTLWLLLNLALLGGGALAFSVSRGFAGWDGLISGKPGDRLQTLGGVIAGEAAAAPPEKRGEVLRRFSAAYGAEFFIFGNDGREIAGAPAQLPAAVRSRLQFRPGRLPGPEAPESGRPPSPPAVGSGARATRGRFLVRTGWPAHFWVGIRVPFEDAEADEPVPATLIARTDSLVGTARLLDWTPWLLAGAAVVVFSVLFWLPFVRSLTRSLGRLTRATERIAEGDFQTRVRLQRRDELGRLGGAVDRMAGRLDTLVNGQKRFLGDVAHELCSPLSRLQLATGILEERAGPGLAEAVADVRDEVQEVATLVDELLAFSKAGLRDRSAALADVALAPLVARVLAREGAADRVAVDVPATLRVAAVDDLLARAVGNLVRNALRYGPEGAITITARAAGAAVDIALTDEGPGVPPEALPRLGEAFYRPESARIRETGGTGLGLAIVRSCVEACRGTVTFQNRSPRGFEVRIRLAGPAA